jgi:hypothetical protein
MFKGSLILLLDSCTIPFPTKLHALTHPPSLLANQGRLWTFDLDKSQVRGRYNCIRDIRRSHCQPLCACVLLSGSENMLAPSCSRENYLVKIFCLLYVCFQHWRVINSNMWHVGPLELGLWPRPSVTLRLSGRILPCFFQSRWFGVVSGLWLQCSVICFLILMAFSSSVSY